jgi:hypothetical protein
MKELKRIWVHALLLAMAAAVAYVKAQPKDPSDVPLQPGEVEIWKASADAVTAVVFEDDKKKVQLERKSDATGAWYAGKVDPVEKKKEEKDAGADPHGHGQGHHDFDKVEAATFPCVSVAKDLAKKLGTLRAKRSFGVIADDRLKEFGFDKPEGTLRVTVAGKEQALLIGGATAGSATRYARHLESKIVYVIDGTAISDLKSGAARLSERNQHEWKWDQPDSVTISGGGKSKRVVHSGTEGRRFWADANSADKNDETSGNWLSKVERLRPNTYLDKLPEGAKRIVRIEYRQKSSEKGFFELYLREDKENPFLIVTEQLRMPATVFKQSAEQVLDDLASVLPGAELPAYTKEQPESPHAPHSPMLPEPEPIAAPSASAAGSAAPPGSAKPGTSAAPAGKGPAKAPPGPAPKVAPKPAPKLDDH